MKTTATYQGFTIEIKRDWGHHGYWDAKVGRCRKRGVVVTDGFCNVIPGAGWFPTVREACIGIDALDEVGLGYAATGKLDLDKRIARESSRAQAWHRAFRRLMRERMMLTPSELRAALAD